MDNKKIKRFLKRPKNIAWIIVIAVFLFLTTLISFVYAKDEPKFISEKTREQIREMVIEGVAEPIGLVSRNMEQKIVNAAWAKEKKENNGNSYGHFEEGNGKKDTRNWPTYTDEETGVSFKYPEGWIVIKGDEGVVSFSPSEESYDLVVVYSDSDYLNVENYWENYTIDWDAVIDEVETKVINGKKVNIYRQLDGMKETHYVLEINNIIYDFVPGGSGYDYVESLISSI